MRLALTVLGMAIGAITKRLRRRRQPHCMCDACESWRREFGQ